MVKNLDEIIAKLPRRRVKKIKDRARELVALELTMQELRKNRKLTQIQIAGILGVSQDNVSRLESRPDIKISTLKSYIQALGGKLHIIADFPDSEPVELTTPESDE